MDKVIADGGCIRKDVGWNDSLLCKTLLRGFRLGNPENLNLLLGMQMRIFNLNDALKPWDNSVIEDYGISNSVKIKNKPNFDGKNHFAGVVAPDYVYNLHFGEGIDWSHFLLFPSYISEPTDKTTILRFNYTEIRETYDVF